MDELWIGLNDLSTQMYFEWSDGTPVTYTTWLPGEPTHAINGREDCVIMAGEVESFHIFVALYYLIFVSIYSFIMNVTEKQIREWYLYSLRNMVVLN